MTTEEAGVTPTCRNHPGVETRLSCSSCGAPICPRCMVATPVGQKCPDCARQPGRARGTPRAVLVAKVAGASLAAAGAGTLLLALIGFPLPFILGGAIGFGVGTLARKVAGGRIHPVLAATATAAFLVGLVGVVLAVGINPLNFRVILAALVGAGITYAKSAGVW
jgi:hypothetical protein